VFRLLRKRFKLKSEDKLRVNPKHLVYYILVWIVCVDDIYKIYKALKVKNKKYLVRMY
jgi:abortive infection bacteriophage resistance protein